MKFKLFLTALFVGALALSGCETMADDQEDAMMEDESMMDDSMDDPTEDGDSMEDDSMDDNSM